MGKEKSIIKYIDDYVNSDQNKSCQVRFPELVTEIQEYAKKMVLGSPAPPYNTDAYWDWVCEQAKWQLHKKIEADFTFDKVMSRYRDYGVVFINR